MLGFVVLFCLLLGLVVCCLVVVGTGLCIGYCCAFVFLFVWWVNCLFLVVFLFIVFVYCCCSIVVLLLLLLGSVFRRIF